MICRTCKQSKSVNEFKKKGPRYDTLCKLCYNLEEKRRDSTPERWAMRSWTRLNMRAGNRYGDQPCYNHVEVRMKRDEFITWALEKYQEWLQNHDISEIPTIDRIDPSGHYEIANIRILSRKENSSHNFDEIRRPMTAGHLAELVIKHAKRLKISTKEITDMIIKEQEKG